MTAGAGQLSRWFTRRQNAVALRDRSVMALIAVMLVGPLEGVSSENVLVALREFAHRRPTHQIFATYDRTTGERYPVEPEQLDDFCATLVEGQPSVAFDDPDAIAVSLHDAPLEQRPFRVSVGRDWVGIAESHSVGDGRFQVELMGQLARAARDANHRITLNDDYLGAPLARSLARTYAMHPSTIISTLRSRRPTLPDQDATRGTVAWAPSLAVATGRSSETYLASTRQWRDASAPRASMAAVLLARGYASLKRQGAEPLGEGMRVLMDLRRYLPAGAKVRGNFIAAPFIRPDDPTDPTSVAEAMRETASSGRALVGLAVNVAAEALHQHAPDQPSKTRPVAGRPELGFTHFGNADALIELPWSGPAAARRVILAGTPIGSHGVTLAAIEVNGVVHTTVRYQRDSFEADVMRDVVDSVCGLTGSQAREL